MRKLIILFLFIQYTLLVRADLIWFEKGVLGVDIALQKNHDAVVDIAMQLFSSDMEAVTGEKPVQKTSAKIEVYQLDRAKSAEVARLTKLGIDTESIMGGTDAFMVKVVHGKIVVVGKNGRGAAYGLLELSREAGVSPWVWWGDCVPLRKEKLSLPDDYENFQSASVEMRGIFLNDEDWSFRPWAQREFADDSDAASHSELSVKSHFRIGPKTYKRVFELLLRLRANALWPAMHEGTEAFFKNPQNKIIADSCGIFVGTSHCEPLLRNNVDEWDVNARGRFNYITNKDGVHKYWIERLQEVAKSHTNIFTIGMRGIHDSSMEGCNTQQEKFDALQQVIDDQQGLLAKYIGRPEKQPQVFVPYKEVLELYEMGLKVPDYVTLMWCDDNYGNITRLSTPDEQKRSGGAGIYYHLSYWGRPHDYLWLTTTQPGLIFNEMRAAYDYNVRKLWIANVHDPKVASYDLELFLDMAWDIDCVSGESLENHYKAWLCRQFGATAGERLFPAMREYWRLTGERKPEFMGWNQNELDKRIWERGLSPVRNTDFSFSEFGGTSEAERYMESYAQIADVVEAVGASDIRPELSDAYFAAIKYPVLGAYNMAVKMLEAQRARSLASGSTYATMTDKIVAMKEACAKSQAAYQKIRELTHYYNNIMTGGKWRNSMDMMPRNQHVFAAPALPMLLSDKEVEEYLAKNKESKNMEDSKNSVSSETIFHSAADFDQTIDSKAELRQLLGHSLSAIALPKGSALVYNFYSEKEGEALLKTALIPTQPNDGGDLRFSVSIDGGEEIIYSLKEPFRSEQWKQNVLRGQALRETKINLSKGAHTLTIRALDNHIILDQWMIDFNLSRKHYLLFPI